jgi:hypothetical protein
MTAAAFIAFFVLGWVLVSVALGFFSGWYSLMRVFPDRPSEDALESLRYQRVVSPDHVVSLGTQAITLPSLPSGRGYAGQTVELSHQLDGTLRVYRGEGLLLTVPLPLPENEDRRPTSRTPPHKRKPSIRRIYNLSGRPALAAVT